ncbi:MAG: energy transducer TonB [Bacteroides sp.]
MEIKKAPSVDLQYYKGIFFLGGLNLALLVCLLLFNWRSRYEYDQEITNQTAVIVEQEEIPMTQQQEQKPEMAPPEAPKIISKINLVDRQVNLEADFDPFNTELNEGTSVDVYEYQEPVEEAEVEEEEVFFFVEEMPSFRGGGLEAFRQYVKENTRYPEAAAEVGIQGKVQVAFVVEPDGSVGRVKVVRSVDPILDKEAVRVVKSSPKWTPGKQRGKPARVGYTIPVVFFLQS